MSGPCQSAQLDWHDESSVAALAGDSSFDVCLAADILYSVHQEAHLATANTTAGYRLFAVCMGDVSITKHFKEPPRRVLHARGRFLLRFWAVRSVAVGNPLAALPAASAVGLLAAARTAIAVGS